MSDLQCAARLLLVRHGEADQALPRSLTLAGRAQAGVVADEFRGERLAGLWSSTMLRAEQTAAILARGLKLISRPDDRLREFLLPEEEMPGQPATQAEADEVFGRWLIGDLGPTLYGESGADVDRRFVEVIQEIADGARGETSLVVSHGGILQLGLTRHCDNLALPFVREHPLPVGAVVEVAVDGDRWWCHRWHDVRLSD
ncbi:histidine phosphatase family protein [Naumannella sp. ID2617S]|uniref:histidine phosphatase family protein n=1 Tax=Enemella dayhoffiae TaxID=2016507 RepID=UPI0014895ACB|nr:histidine phosphatase family protein [Enemella dayhoffiae]NNG20873.1 histidine phosphatase family protein [Naumannella sp. ID2617S]